jgi:Holliday junction resolvasome RuvABC endonuclease subunit
MIKALLSLQGRLAGDAADALAIALCHAHHRNGAALRRAGAAR